MKVRFLKQISSPVCGNRLPGDVADVPDDFGKMLLSYGSVERLEEVKAGPFGGNGQAKPSASSQAAQALTMATLATSEESAESSPSTQASELPSGVTQSMPVTESGGSDTTEKPRRSRRGGRRTRTQQTDTD